MCCLEKPKRETERERGEDGVGGGGALFKKQGKKGGEVKRGADRRRRFRGGGEGLPAGAVAGPCLWGEGERGGARGREGRS